MPSVPPDAANIVKRVFKGIFKRGKKGKQDGTDSNTATSTSTPPPQNDPSSSTAPTAQSPPPSQIDAKAPQLPPLASASPLQSATEESRPVPPTHPLSTGEHSAPQEAVPQNKDAEPAPGPPLGAATTAGGSETLKEPEKLGAGTEDVSPPVSTVDTADAPKSGAVSAISNEQGKADGVAEGTAGEEVKAEESRAVEPTTQSMVTPLRPTQAETAETAEPTSTTTKENVPPQTNGTAPTESISSPPPDATAAAPTDPTPDADTAKPAPSDEKMPTMEEPPPIKAVRAAPGMSATSGPLEDFPEGGDVKD